MPTGYTQKILDGCTFEEFVMECAKRIGYLYKYGRSGEDIPEKIELNTYHKEQIEKYKEKIEKLNSMTIEDAKEKLKEKRKKLEKDRQATINRNEEIKEKYNDMLEKVRNWNPPTKEHEPIKEFMIEQIDKSKDWDEHSIPKINEIYYKPKKWLEKQKESCIDTLNHHQKSWREELEYNKKQNRWLKKLRESLGE